MTLEDKEHITYLSKKFADGFKPEITKISGSGFLIVDPLSGYLNSLGYENTLKELPQNKTTPQILIMTFKDGTVFVPAGSDLPSKGTFDWMWLDNNDN